MSEKPIVLETDIKYIRDIKITVRGAARNVNNLQGQVELAFYRGYQAGYEAHVDGKTPEFHARTEKEPK